MIKRNFITQILGIVILFIFSLITQNTHAQQLAKDELPSLKGKKILMVWGGWEGHEPKQVTYKLKPLLEKEGAIITVSDSLGVYANKELMSSVDLIIQAWTMGKISKEQEKGLLDAVKNGTGIAGAHGGLGDSFRENTGYQYMVGGQWVAHPGNIHNHTINITDKNDPITRGINDFQLNSEQYYMHIDPNVKVLATTSFTGEFDNWIDGAVMPVAWKKTFGKGRVFYLSPGHVADDFNSPELMELFLRGIRWASGSKYLPKEEWMSPVYPGKN
ncbi:MAG: ThuA domain-containing protein [Mariniphaga sp.]|jgi:type 1 glutamine amidotransferase|nr:ThuA domain-containing protein [Mariniphaga sp.]